MYVVTAGLAGLDPMPRNRGLLGMRAVKPEKYGFDAYIAASPRVVMPPYQSASSGTSVTLTGSCCGSAGSFCAVTVTVGSVTDGGVVCACATAGVRRANASRRKR